MFKRKLKNKTAKQRKKMYDDKVCVSFLVDAEQYDELLGLAKSEGTSISVVMREALEAHLA